MKVRKYPKSGVDGPIWPKCKVKVRVQRVGLCRGGWCLILERLECQASKCGQFRERSSHGALGQWNSWDQIYVSESRITGEHALRPVGVRSQTRSLLSPAGVWKWTGVWYKSVTVRMERTRQNWRLFVGLNKQGWGTNQVLAVRERAWSRWHQKRLLRLGNTEIPG